MNVTTKQASELFQVNKSTLVRWRDAYDDGVYVGHNAWDLKKLIELWVENVYTGTKACDDESVNDAKNRYWTAKAGLEAIKLREAEGQLVKKDQIAEAWAARVSALTAGLQALVMRLPPRLIGLDQKSMRTIIDAEVWALRDSFSRTGAYTPKQKKGKKK